MIIIDPKYQMNVGYIARVAKNFGVDRLFFVSPRASIKGKKAVMYSKHAVEMLKSAKVYGNLDDAVADCDLVVGTTGILRNGPRYGNTCTPERAVQYAEKTGGTVALLIGRDDRGLTVEELGKCDLIVHIGSNSEYPVLNISHALSVLLYVFTKKDFAYADSKVDRPSKHEVDALMATFSRMIKDKKIRDKKGVSNIFRKMVRRSRLNSHELHAVITAFK